MDWVQVVEKALRLIPVVVSAGQNAQTIIDKTMIVVRGVKAGGVTPFELDALEAELDAAIEKFNLPMA